MRPARASLLLALVLLLSSLAWTAPQANAAARTMGGGPLADIQNLAAQQTMCTGLTPDRLAAMAMVPTFPETGAPTNQAPSPMTLSRWDNQSTLYAFATPGLADKAFFHPGIGMWQFDSAGGWPLTAATAINTATAALQAVPMMRNRFCAAGGDDAARRKYAWGAWLECQSGTLCEGIYASLLVNDVLTVDQDALVQSMGGMEQRSCMVQNIGSVTCFYVDPAKAQGYNGFATFPAGNGASPLTAPFYVFDYAGREYRYWLRADTGYPNTIEADKVITANARTGLTWRYDDGLCDTTANRGACGPIGPAWSGVWPFGGASWGEVVGANNADGRLELFVVGTDQHLYHVWQPSTAGGWSSWSSLGGSFPLNARPAVEQNADGRLEVFLRGTDNALWHIFQVVPNGGWSAFQSLGGILTADPSTGANADGHLEVFVRGTDGAIWHNWQTAPNAPFGSWQGLGGVWPGGARLAVATNDDGRLEVFGVASDGAIWHNWQVGPNSWWYGWSSLGGSWPKGRDVAVARNQDGRLELTLLAGDGRLWGAFQLVPNGGWSGYLLYDALSYTQAPSLRRDAAGRLVLALMANGGLAIKTQAAPNQAFGGTQQLGGRPGNRPSLVNNPDNRLEAFYVGNDLGIAHAWMLSPA